LFYCPHASISIIRLSNCYCQFNIEYIYKPATYTYTLIVFIFYLNCFRNISKDIKIKVIKIGTFFTMFKIFSAVAHEMEIITHMNLLIHIKDSNVLILYIIEVKTVTLLIGQRK